MNVFGLDGNDGVDMDLSNDDSGVLMKRFGDLEVGDVVLGPDGDRVEVKEAYPVHVPETMFELTLENNETIEAGGSHLWYVETEHDLDFHSVRVREGKRIFKKLPKEMIELLEEYAADRDKEIVTSVDTLVQKIGLENFDSAVYAIIRVAESLGPIEELDYRGVGLDSGESFDGNLVPVYDGKLMSQQILLLTGKRKYRKKWNLVKGRVMRTDSIIDLDCAVEIPTFRNGRLQSPG